MSSKTMLKKLISKIQSAKGFSDATCSQMKGKIFKSVWKDDIKGLDSEDQKELAHQFLNQESWNDKYFGTLIFDKIKGSVEFDDIKRVQKLFEDGAIEGWAHTDIMSGSIFRPWAVGNKDNVKYICNWKNSDCIWLQRASCVTFVFPAKHSDKSPNFEGFTDMLIDVCKTTIKNQERFVQLGTGWLLRNIGIENEEKLLGFIETYLEHFTREGLRYAVEKLDGVTRKRMMSLKVEKNRGDLEEEVEQEAGEEVRRKKKKK